MSPSANSQRGVALLTILLLVVSITVVAGAMLASQKIAIRRSGLLFNQDQLLQDIDAAKQLAVTTIRADDKLNDTDSLQDIWAQPIPAFTLGDHNIGIELRDEASRFNINNLYHDGKADTAALAVLQRLFTQLNVDPQIAIAILDWQDADSEVYNDGGNETTLYSQSGARGSQSLPNQPFVSVDQLLAVRGVDDEVLAKVQGYLTAIPYYLPINVNTASPQLLASLVEGASAQQLQGLVALREQQVVESIDSLWQQPSLSALNEEQRQAITPLVAVNSQAFMALVTASDSADGTNSKQRFATLLISKIDEYNNSNSSQNGASNNTETNNSANSNAANSNANNNVNSIANNGSNDNFKAAKTIKVISQRLWAFQPNF